ncbi:MAG: TRAP transporter small permease [Pseudomonadota bacterium]|nr:TRAP transporter small permease [Pseudomonadota bacterium]
MLRLVERLSQAAAMLGGLAIIGVAVLVCVEVMLRTVFGIGLSAATEISSYVLAVTSAWAFSYALLRRVHVRVDALIRLFPQRIIAWFDLLALLALAWLASMMLWYGASVFSFSFVKGSTAMTPLQTPLWIPQGLWLLGLGLFFITSVIMLVVVGRCLIKGDAAQVNRLVGSFTVEEEALDEIKDARRRESELSGTKS